MNQNSVGIIGAGSQAEEIKDYLATQGIEVDFLAVDKEYKPVDDQTFIDISSPTEEQLGKEVICAIGAPELKKKMIAKWQGNQYFTSVDPSVIVSPDFKCEQGSIVAPGVVITTNVLVGKHCLINIGSTLSHDVIIGDFSTISPGVHIGGKTNIGKGVFVGIGAVVSNNLKIADGVVIGAGSVLLDDALVENGTYVGCPARHIKTNEGWLAEI